MTDDAEAMARAAADLAATSDLTPDEALRLMAEAAGLLESSDIVRALATKEEPAKVFAGRPLCSLCGRPLDGRREPNHDPSCPWRRAVAWVKVDEHIDQLKGDQT